MTRCPVCSAGRLSEYLRSVSGLSGTLQSATFSEYVHLDSREQQLRAAKEIAERGHGWLTLWGDYGRSKTYLLACIVNHALANNRPAVYTTAGRLLDHLRDAYGPGRVGFSAAFDHWRSCQVLAIDEANVFHETPWANDKYRQLIEHRYNLADRGDSITLFACNPQPGGDDWPEALGWLASRMSRFNVVQAAGCDIRPLLHKKQKGE